jgi:subtilisin family serine protease
MKQGWLKNTALATILSTTLTACGGGGGGGGVGVVFDPPSVSTISFSSDLSGQLVGDFISVVHTLSQDELLDVKDAVEIFKWVENNKPKFDNNELENYRITIDEQEMSLQKGFNMLLGFKKKYYDGKETFWENTANTGQFDDEDEDYLALKSTALEDLEKQKDDKQSYFDELEETGKATMVSTAEKSTFSDPIYGEAVLGESTVSDTAWKEISSESGESEVSVSTVQETTDAGAVYEVETTTTTTPTIKTYQRTVTTTTPRSRSKSIVKTTRIFTTWSNGTKTIDVKKTTLTTTEDMDPDKVEKVEERTETIEGTPIAEETGRTLITNPVIDTVTLEPTITEVVTESATHPESVTVDVAGSESSYTEEGSATTDTTYTYSSNDVDNGDNTLTRTTKKHTVTTVTLPITTYYTKVQTTTTKLYKDVTTTTTTTPRTQKFYADGTDEIVLGTATESQAIVKTFVSQSEQSATVPTGTDVANTITTSTDEGVVHLVETISTEYTDFDTNLGTRTTGYDTDKTTYETLEYNESNNGYKVYEKINVSSAYSRGWTGKGSIVAVADTGYDTDHTEFDGQVIRSWRNAKKHTYINTNGSNNRDDWDEVYFFDFEEDKKNEFLENNPLYEYNKTEDEVVTMTNGITQDGKIDTKIQDVSTYLTRVNGEIVELPLGHGSHVLGTIVAKKDGTGMHGVAFDAKAVVIKIGESRSVSLDDAASGFSWAADQGAIVGNLSANSNYDSGFRTSITKIADDTYKTTSPDYDYENGTYYNNMTPDAWKAATDKGMVLVNSAGNQGLDVSAMPGWFATETDADGNLVLGGKVLIVGSYNFSTNNIDGFSNKAGHLCRVIIDDTCRDQYKTSDFYVLAPGWTYSTNKDGSYGNMHGTSMAAPIVTGQIAILHQMWPHMKGENLVKLVTTTADKSITGYDVNIHGQGVVDFDEATKPQGAIGIPTTGRVDGAISSVSGTQISGSGSIKAAISDIKIMVVDDFDRDYYLNLGNSFTVKDNRKYSDVQMLVDNKNTFLPQQQMYGSFAQGGQWDLAKDYNFGFYTGENGNGDYSVNVGKDFYIGNNFKLKTSLGHMSEQETWLGNSSEGVLAVGDNNDTLSKNIGVEYQIGNNVLSLDYSRGMTDINTVDDSLIKSFSGVETESYRLAYEIHKDKHNTLGWSFSLPSHVTSGTMDLEVAESVNLDGTINYTNIRSDLTQSTKEKNIGFYLNHTPTHDTDAAYKFTAEYRQDVAGESGRDGVNLAMNYTKKFWGSCKFLWMKNPKCYTKGKDGKEVLTAQHQAMMFGNNDIDTATMHGLKYDLKTDKFIPINPEDEKWKQ